MASTSHSLLDQLQQGPDTLAWKRWHSLYEPLILGWLRQHRLIPTDRDDIVQNVLTVVVQKLPAFQHNGQVGAFRKWLKTITIFCLRDYWKAQQKHPQHAHAQNVLDQWADDQSTLSQAWDEQHDRQLLQKLMLLLEPEFTPETWRAFRGVVMEDRPAQQVAQDLSISINAVYIAKSRVLTRLRQEAAGLVEYGETKDASY